MIEMGCPVRPTGRAKPWFASLLLVMLQGLALTAGAFAGPLGRGYDFAGNGKRPGELQREDWRPDAVPAVPAHARNDRALAAATINLVAARAPASATLRAGNLRIRHRDLVRTATRLRDWLAGDGGMGGGASVDEREPGWWRTEPLDLDADGKPPAGGGAMIPVTPNGPGNPDADANRPHRMRPDPDRRPQAGPPVVPPGFRAWRLAGEDGQGNVQFTGYFSPELEARRKPDARFRFPLYRLPAKLPKPWPTRAAIDHGGALAGKGLEIAWVDDLLEAFFLHVQGSGRLRFADGSTQWVQFAGSNGHPYQSLGRMLVERGSIPAEKISLRAIRDWMRSHPEDLVPLTSRNPSYVFFREVAHPARGAAQIDLAAGHSVAADLKVIPKGACLVAEVPRLDETGTLVGYQTRLLFVHDMGGAINGPGHLDLFFGHGRAAGDAAGNLHHYGRVWLLLAED